MTPPVPDEGDESGGGDGPEADAPNPEIGVVIPDEFVDDDVEDDVTVDVTVVGSLEDDVEEKVLDVVDDDVLDTDVLVEDDASAVTGPSGGGPGGGGAAEGLGRSPGLAEVSAGRCRSVCWISA